MPDMMSDPFRGAGWEPDTPVSDSLLRAFIVNWTASIEAQGRPLGGRLLQRDDLAAVDVGHPAFGGNVVTLLAPLVPDRVAEVVSVLDTFYRFSAGGNTGTVYLFSPWPTPDLRPHGWSLLEHLPFMMRPPGGTPPPPPVGLRIAAVENPDGMRAFERAVVRGFEAADLEALEPGMVFSPEMLADERCRFWVGWEGDEPVSAAASFVMAGINDVTIVATVPTARRRGYGEAMTWRATLADPTLPALLIATEAGQPVYERMGYLSLSRWTLWSRDRPAASGQDA